MLGAVPGGSAHCRRTAVLGPFERCSGPAGYPRLTQVLPIRPHRPPRYFGTVARTGPVKACSTPVTSRARSRGANQRPSTPAPSAVSVENKMGSRANQSPMSTCWWSPRRQQHMRTLPHSLIFHPSLVSATRRTRRSECVEGSCATGGAVRVANDVLEVGSTGSIDTDALLAKGVTQLCPDCQVPGSPPP